MIKIEEYKRQVEILQSEEAKNKKSLEDAQRQVCYHLLYHQ